MNCLVEKKPVEKKSVEKKPVATTSAQVKTLA
jgi:hypothetical protein